MQHSIFGNLSCISHPSSLDGAAQSINPGVVNIPSVRQDYKPGQRTPVLDKKPLCFPGVVPGSGLRRPDSPSHFGLPHPTRYF